MLVKVPRFITAYLQWLFKARLALNGSVMACSTALLAWAARRTQRPTFLIWMAPVGRPTKMESRLCWRRTAAPYAGGSLDDCQQRFGEGAGSEAKVARRG